ncbi:MAG: hypothetical protein ACRD1Z_11655 [Vicinamibacteria bacterium]
MDTGDHGPVSSWGARAEAPSTRHYGDADLDRELRQGLRGWCVDDSWFETTSSDCRFMHCLPVRRNVVVSDSVLDGPRSIVLKQARNRLYAQMGVLHAIMKGSV